MLGGFRLLDHSDDRAFSILPTCLSLPDLKLVALVQESRKAQRLIEDNRDQSIAELAVRMGRRPVFLNRLIRLNYLAPDIVTSILDGTQPAALTRDVLLKASLPTDWSLQRKLFGFPKPERTIPPRNLFGRGMWPTRILPRPLSNED